MNKLGTINPISQTSVTEIDKVLEGVTIKHDIVSDINTPKAYIKKKMDMDYVEVGYMKKIADKHYPGWSWEVIKTEFAGTQAYVVHGRLKWYDSGIQRTGDMTAAHRIQRKRANTDCMKKAFNMYMNIADDVYRNQVEDTELTDKQVADLIKVALGVSEEKASEINIMIEEGVIHGLNYKGALAKLKRQGEK